VSRSRRNTGRTLDTNLLYVLRQIWSTVELRAVSFTCWCAPAVAKCRPMERFHTRIMRIFGQQLKAARIDAGFRTAKEFADALGVEPPTYRYWERGKSLPDLVTVARICKLLQRDANYFLPDALSGTDARRGNDGSRAA